MKKETKEGQKAPERTNSKENIFTIRSYEVTNKTLDSFSDIDDFTNSKNMSNFNMSNIFDNLKEKEKSLANPFTFKTILEDVGQDSILEKSVSAFKKKTFDDRPLKKSQGPNPGPPFENPKKEENLRYEPNNIDEKTEKNLKNINSFEKIRSVTPKIERSQIKNMPGSTRSITPLDKGDRDLSKLNCLEKVQKTPDNQNNYQSKIFAEISANKEIRKVPSQYEFISSKIQSIRNDGTEHNKENLKEKQMKKIASAGGREDNVLKFTSKFNNHPKDPPQSRSKSKNAKDDYTKSLEEELEKKNEEILKLKHEFHLLEQENYFLKDQNKKILKEKSQLDEELKKKQGKFKGDIMDLEQNNFSLLKELKECRRENEEKSKMIHDLLSELTNQAKKPSEKKNSAEFFQKKNTFKEDESIDSNEEESFLRNQFLKERKLATGTKNENANEKFSSIFKNFCEGNEVNSGRKPQFESKDVFSTRNKQNSNNKRKENESSIKILEILQKNQGVKTTPDNLSSKRNRKGHISPMDFPSSRNQQENHLNYPGKNLKAMETFNSHNENNIFSEDKYKLLPSTNPHKYKENPLFSAKNDEGKLEKNSGKKNLFNLLQEKNGDFYDFGTNKNQPLSSKYGLPQNSNVSNGHSKNDSSSNSSYLSYLQKNHQNKNNTNQTSEIYADNEKSDNGTQIYIQSSPRKFNKNLNEVIIDLSKRCQTSSNSNLAKAEKILKDKSLEKININIMDLKNKHKDPILPKPRSNFERNPQNFLIGREDNYDGKHPYLAAGTNRRSSLNIEADQNKRGASIKPIGEVLNSSKKERSRSILSEKYLHDD